MRRCSIFVTLLKNEYIEIEFNKARCFCSFRCLSNPYSCTITSLIFRTQGIHALLSVRKFLPVQVSVRIVPCATFLVCNIPRAQPSVRKFPREHLSGFLLSSMDISTKCPCSVLHGTFPRHCHKSPRILRHPQLRYCVVSYFTLV